MKYYVYKGATNFHIPQEIVILGYLGVSANWILFLSFSFVQVKIMLPWDPAGKMGPKRPLPDHVQIVEPKEETLPTSPFSETKAVKPDQPPVPV